MNPPSLLIVDDEPAFLKAARKVLSRGGFEVVTADNLVRALAALENRGFDAVIADLSLQGIRGREGLEIARAAKRHDRNVKVVLVTAVGSDEVNRSARECGVDLCLDKPLSLQKLRRLLAGLGIVRQGSPN